MHLGAWLLLLAVAFVTLSPVDLRPGTGGSAQLERFVAFALIGSVFVLAYPRRFPLVVALVLGSAVIFEVLQFFAHTRHPGMADALAKLAGGCFGLVLGWALLWCWRQLRAANRSG